MILLAARCGVLAAIRTSGTWEALLDGVGHSPNYSHCRSRLPRRDCIPVRPEVKQPSSIRISLQRAF